MNRISKDSQSPKRSSPKVDMKRGNSKPKFGRKKRTGALINSDYGRNLQERRKDISCVKNRSGPKRDPPSPTSLRHSSPESDPHLESPVVTATTATSQSPTPTHSGTKPNTRKGFQLGKPGAVKLDKIEHVILEEPVKLPARSKEPLPAKREPIISTSPVTSANSFEPKPASPKYNLENEVSQPLADQFYFHGILPRRPSETLLKKTGDYLVRLTKYQGKCSIVISIKLTNRHLHVMVKEDQLNNKYYLEEQEKFDSVPKLILHYHDHNLPFPDEMHVILRESIGREDWELNNSQVELKEFLGKGQFGEAYKGFLTTSDGITIKVAVKTCNESISDEDKKTFVDEAQLMRQFTNENIIKIYGVALSDEPLMIVMEIAERGSLEHYLEKHKGNIPRTTKLKWIIMAARGMEYLESKRVIHRDLAARNCLLDRNLVLKISDFGLSAQGDQIHLAKTDKVQLPIRWVAPESIKDWIFTTKSDLWSFGVVIWEIYSEGLVPYRDMIDNKLVMKYIIRGGHLDPPEDCPIAVTRIMLQCFATNPENRPSFEQIRLLLVSYQMELDDFHNKTMSLSTLCH